MFSMRFTSCVFECQSTTTRLVVWGPYFSANQDRVFPARPIVYVKLSIWVDLGRALCALSHRNAFGHMVEERVRLAFFQNIVAILYWRVLICLLDNSILTLYC